MANAVQVQDSAGALLSLPPHTDLQRPQAPVRECEEIKNHTKNPTPRASSVPSLHKRGGDSLLDY